MALFRREPEATPNAGTRPAGERARPVTRIASGTRIEGKVGGSADLLVEGEVEGEVAVEATATVAPAGRVVGRVSAHVVVVAGVVEGDVEGRDRVELAATARMTGDVSAAKVVLAEGAFLQGSVEMRGRSAAPADSKES
ncbi:MAG: polymer-forming cytoskeletal protein [Acidobacteria bacterium]|nr:polymer-forming cytoskeletal protein [Acidobacteriota bacterium]